MGNSSCSNLLCNYEKNIEFTSQFNQPTSNNISQKIIKYNNSGIIQNEFFEEKKLDINQKLIPKINGDIINLTNNQDIKLLVNNINIREISFPIDKKKLGNESEKLYEKIEKLLLSKFYPCDENEINNVEICLIKLLVNIKNNIYKNIEENKLILSGKLQKLINFTLNSYGVKKQSERFCVLYNNIFKYYKSEIQFLKGLKPLNILYLDQIARINLVRGDINSKKLNYIIICNKYAMEKEEENYQNFGNDINDNIYVNHSNESIIIFTSEEEDIIYKWFAYLNFLIYNRKDN